MANQFDDTQDQLLRNRGGSECVLIAASPILLRPKQAAAVCGMSRSFFDSQVNAGRIGPKPVTIGSLKLWPRTELERWVDAGCPGRVEWIGRAEGGCDD